MSSSDATRPRVMHRISNVYAVAGLAVPLFGVATAAVMGVLGDVWVLASIVLTVLAAGLVAGLVLLAQFEVVEALAPDTPPAQRDRATASARRLSMVTGLFALTWALVVVLMVVRPGSTTGV